MLKEKAGVIAGTFFLGSFLSQFPYFQIIDISS